MTFAEAIKAKSSILIGSVKEHLLSESPSGGASASEIYTYFTSAGRADAFKADVSGLSTFNPAVDVVARVTLVDTTTTNSDIVAIPDATDIAEAVWSYEE